MSPGDKPGGGHLIEQRLKQVIVVTIDQRDSTGASASFAAQVKPPKPAPTITTRGKPSSEKAGLPASCGKMRFKRALQHGIHRERTRPGHDQQRQGQHPIPILRQSAGPSPASPTTATSSDADSKRVPRPARAATHRRSAAPAGDVRASAPEISSRSSCAGITRPRSRARRGEHRDREPQRAARAGTATDSQRVIGRAAG